MADFTRRHYQTVAKILRDETSGETNTKLCNIFGEYFAKDNSRFDWQRWNKACQK